MPRIAIALIAFALAACSEEAPPPAPAAPAAKAEPAATPPAPPAPEPKAAAPKPDANAELAARVKRALEDEAKVQAAAIDVTAADGKVTLWGTAPSDAERARAAQAAGKVEGVKAVENKIAVVRGS
jgi:hypothetical protein